MNIDFKDFSKEDKEYVKLINKESKRIMKDFRPYDSYKKFYHKGNDKCYIYCKEGYFDKYDKEENEKITKICYNLLDKIK